MSDVIVSRLIEADLHQMQADVYDCNTSNGWFDSGRSFGTDLALLHSEVSEMFEAFRDHGLQDMTGEMCQTDVDGIHLHGAKGVALCKPEGVGSEAADVLIRWLDHAQRHNLDPQLAYISSLDMHWSEIAEFGDWIALLHKAISDLEGTPVSGPWSAYVATLSILDAFCMQNGIDLLAEYDRKLAFNRTRGYKHGGKSV